MPDIIAIASDHAGFELKEILKNEAIKLGYEIVDLGTDGKESVDYPDFGYMAAKMVAEGKAKAGVIICGSGIGISIAANRNPKVRAAPCHNVGLAKLAREHNDANILALGSRVVDEKTAIDCLRVFFNTEFAGGRHQKRVEKLGDYI